MHDWNDEWIKNKILNRSKVKNVWKDYMNTFEVSMSYDTFKNYVQKKGFFQNLIDNDKKFIIEHSELNNKDIAYLLGCKVQRISYLKKSMGLKSRSFTYWTEEMDEMLTALVGDVSYAVITEILNEYFCTFLSNDAVSARVRHLNLGRSAKERKYKFYEEKTSRNVVYVKFPDVENGIRWIRKDKMVFEKTTGRKVKDDEFLFHIDGNAQNCNFDNLYLTKIKHMGYVGKMIRNNRNPELRMTVLKYAELNELLKNESMKGEIANG